MANRKEYELIMKLSAALGPNFHSSFKTAMTTINQTQNTLQNFKKQQGDISAYQKTQDAIATTKTKLEDYAKKYETLQTELTKTTTKEKELQAAVKQAQQNMAAEEDVETYKKLSAEHDNLQKELAETTTEKRKLQSKIKDTTTATENATRKIDAQEKELGELSNKLQQAGVDTKNLAEETAKLEKQYEDIKKAQENYANATAALDKNKQAISETRTELLKTTGQIAAVGAALYVPIKGAMEFESSMAEVAKVVDWIGTGNNATAEQIQQYSELSDGLYNLTRQIPMTAQEFAQITAAAGQANVAMDNASLLKFAEDAAKMGVAFDISAEQAGDWMAKWRTAFGMSQADVVELSDKINYLGNTTPATAAQISNVVTRIGPLGEVAGLASGDIAALGAAIVGVGIGEEVAATGIKNLMLDMTKGTATTKKMNAVLATMGIDATDLANRMQTDATGAIMDFMRALKELPAAEQAAALNNYFGQESVGAIAPLLNNLGMLEEQFNKVADAQIYAGSMEGEYAARAATSENTVQLMQNALKELSDTFGTIFVPSAENGAQAITELLYKTTDFVKENGETIKTVMAVVAGLLAAKAAFFGVKLVVLQVQGVYLAARSAMAAYTLVKAIMTASEKAGAIATLATAKAQGVSTGTLIAGKAALLAKTVATNAATAAQKLYNTVLSKNPIGIIIIAVTTLIALFMKLSGTSPADALQPLQSVFENIKPLLTEVMASLKELGDKVFPLLLSAAQQIIPAISRMAQEVLPKILTLIEAILPILTTLATSAMTVFAEVLNAVLPVLATLIQEILPVFLTLIETLLPVITTLVTTALSMFVSVLNMLLPPLMQLIQDMLPILTRLTQTLTTVIQVLASAFGGALTGAINALMPIIQNIMTVFQGLIDFVTGVFTGNWTQAWEGIKNIFAGIFGGLVELVKAPFRVIVGTVNGVIGGLNKLKVPDWIPGIGGQGINIPLIPMFEKGSNYTPDTFIAGDVSGKGGELITNARGRKVFTEAATTKIFSNINMAKEIIATNAAKSVPVSDSDTPKPPIIATVAQRVGGFVNTVRDVAVNRAGEMTKHRIPSIPNSRSSGDTFKVEYNPVIHVDGNKPGDLEEKLKQHAETLLQMVREMRRKEKEDEGRMAYV